MNGRWVEKGLLGGAVALAPGFARLGSMTVSADDEADGGGGAPSVVIDGGTVANSTDVGGLAGGGVAVADVSGGVYNIAFVS